MERLPHEIAALTHPAHSAPGGMPTRGVVALRTALQAQLRRGLAPDESTRRAVALFCAEAKRRDLRAEQVLVLLKDVWRTLPEVRRLRRTQREPALAQLTTLAIRTFYDPTPSLPGLGPRGELADRR